ncbi:gamma-glutamylcyclotransferase [Mesorhizobium sp. B2-5-13]|uniref:gamma-glutamylcyclotransferase family protein n=1 Tax=unclassified Mesorhizobium TaxID=325217 RepID=UPI0011281FEB|nr:MULTISPECIES: gamma-glutamylcyclotransferase family protein [unclassified Mesorhizobium]TPJ90624.1 gamma-glutamylcyclotransferase [Mesorhizobium sp. B2-5-13]TPK54743.1 gamma-glutamylcyclotransferase [Mesorhizobium sp. B2-5-5]
MMSAIGASATLAERIKGILAAVKPLAAEYYQVAGKPLGVTGEVTEYVASTVMGLELAPPRTTGYDAVRHTPAGPERIQIKGRAYDPAGNRSQRIGQIKPSGPCDTVMLVLLHNATLDPVEIWEAPFPAVVARLAEPGSISRNERGALAVSDFKRLGRQVCQRTKHSSISPTAQTWTFSKMKERCPDAEIVGSGHLPGYALCFPRMSMKRKCAVSSVEPFAGGEVWGVVYRLTAADLALLDRNEGYQSGRDRHLNSYTRLPVTVTMNGVATEMQTYFAEPQSGKFLPSAAYLQHLRDGARHHRLPDSYLALLHGLEAIA